MYIKWRKLNRVVHRDFGYFFTATTLIYALSGIALNHVRDWNPNYIISSEKVAVKPVPEKGSIDKEWVMDLLDQTNDRKNYKNHYIRDNKELKVFLKGGSLILNLNTGTGWLEKIRKRPVFHEVNYLHYNPGKWWTWFSDIYAGSLAILAITGLFVLKGKNGITGRGAWFTLAGVVVPLVLLYLLL